MVEKTNGAGTELTAPAAKGAFCAQGDSLVMVADPSPSAPSLALNFDPRSPLGAKILLGAQGVADETPETIGEKPFPLAYWLVKRVLRTDEATGEIKASARTTLVTADGVRFACESLGVLESLDLIRQIYGDGPYDPPIRVRVERSKTGQGRRYYYLVAAD